MVFHISDSQKNRKQIPARIQTGQLSTLCFTMRRAEKIVELPTFSLGILNICICLRPHYIKRARDISLMIIRIAVNFKAVQNFLQRSRKFDIKWGIPSTVLLLSSISVFQNANNLCEPPLKQTQWGGQRIKQHGKGTLLMFKGKKITDAEGFSNVLNHNHFLFHSELVWSMSWSRAFSAVWKYKTLTGFFKLWYMKAGLLWMWWGEIEELCFSFALPVKFAVCLPYRTV